MRWLASGGAEQLREKLLDNAAKRLSSSYLDLIQRMIVVDPAKRATLSELLRSSCLQAGKGTVEKHQYTMLGLFCCPKGLRHPEYRSKQETPQLMGEIWFKDPDMLPHHVYGQWQRIDRLMLEVDMRKVTDALPIGTREILPAARFPDDMLNALTGPSRIYPRVLHFSGHGLKDGLLAEGSDGKPRKIRIDEFVTEMRNVLERCTGLECVM